MKLLEFGQDGHCYIGSGHGWNDELTKLINEKHIKYARESFRLSILEIKAMSTSDDAIISRESHWKEVVIDDARSLATKWRQKR